MSQVSRVPFRWQPLAAGLAAALLASCGGGGGGNSPTPTPVATAPQFTSATTTSVAENSTGTFYNATATDPQGDPISFSLLAGGDADKFTLTGGNALRFNVAPDFELPGDADGNNIYQVTIRATAGGEFVDQSLQVTVTNDREGIAVRRVATGFGPDAVIGAPLRQPGIFVVKQDGAILRVSGRGSTQDQIANAFLAGESGRVMSVGHLNNHVMVMLDVAGKGVFVRAFPLSTYPHTFLQVKLAEASATPAVGTLFNERAGFLWAALGDPTGNLAQDSASGYGKLFRVQAFANCGASVSGIWCMFSELKGDGIHAPGGGAYFDKFSLLIDRGTDRKDEITLYDPNWVPLDFGWPFYEGDVAIRANPPALSNGPSLVMARSNEFRGVSDLVGGAVYNRGSPQLFDKLIFGDANGKIFAFPAAKLGDGVLHKASEVENRTADFTPDVGTINSVRGIVLDEDAFMYVLDADGELFLVG